VENRYKRPRDAVWLLIAVAAAACATLTPEGARVQVFQAPLDRSVPAHDMPHGCALLSSRPQVSMTELEMQGQKHPFWAEQNEAASVGANVVLVRSRLVISRHPRLPGRLPQHGLPARLRRLVRRPRRALRVYAGSVAHAVDAPRHAAKRRRLR
jgi:hypothetical protein